MQSSEFDYKKYLQLLIRRKELFVVLALLIMTAGIILSFVLPKKYEAKSTVFIEKNVISELVKGITVTPSMEDTIKVLTYAITSRTLLSKAADTIDMNLAPNIRIDNEELVKKLQKNIDIQVKDKNLFIISYKDSNPKTARDFVNTLVRLYIEENTSSKRDESYDATKFLSEQINTFKAKLEKAQNDVNAYKRDKGSVIAIDEGKLFEEINTAQQKLYDMELKRRQLEGMRQVTKKSGNPLQAKLLSLQKKLGDLRSEYTDNYPEVIRIKGEIETIQEQMKGHADMGYQSLDPTELAKIDAEIAAIKVSEEGMRRYIATNQSLLRNIPSAKAGLDKLELEKNNQKNIYDQLFARHGQSEVSKQMEVQDKSTTFRVVDPAILPTKPVSPNRLKIMLMGIIGGIAGSFGILLLLDQMDTSVKDVNFIKDFNVPVLAVIPHINDARELAAQRRRATRLFTIASIYFLFILCFPAMELMGSTYVDKIFNNINLSDLVQGIKDNLR
ncbi:XrtA system polysaccharide chain length determinant [Geobacter sp. AOG2]|uniref:XrtA system polysaccharide chain length determinant n=1 Tax=Geobacter sp. AOG2 TaxID=1566347 RepID=UPI001CC44CC4|nr:XrtA system polysaccharide chain length determinant [Geobacter sp. AOG2]GFE60811.1 chain-length determining protein [Geobacter sp. AOG2]